MTDRVRIAAIRRELRAIALVICAAAAGVAVVALLVELTAAGAARHVLAYPFPHGTLGWAGVISILVSNARLALAPLAASLLLGSVRPGEGCDWSRGARLVRWGCDAVLSGAVFVNLFVAGASYGAYGMRMVRYTLPYAPFELAGFACTLTVYLAARRRAPGTRKTAWLTGAAVLLLSAGAMLEGLLPAL